MKRLIDNSIFENLFVLEMANNHLGKLERGLKIIEEYGQIVHYNGVKAAIKLQFRDVDHFIHDSFKGSEDIRYIKKTETTKLTKEEYRFLVDAIKYVGCIPMATPFDEASVDLCVELGLEMIKVASSDINDWFLIKKIAETRLPVIISTGGASEHDLDAIVAYFDNRHIPIAINHCVSLYPSKDHELDLDQIDYLKHRFPEHVIGLSSHEYGDWHSSMLISYAKGARTWERHIDIDYEDVVVSPYCSLPYQIDEWFKAYHKAREMCGGKTKERRFIPQNEIAYLAGLVRGVYARKNLEPGYVFSNDTITNDFYLAIPLQKGQLSCRELVNGEKLIKPITTNDPLTIEHIGGVYQENNKLRDTIKKRGL